MKLPPKYCRTNMTNAHVIFKPSKQRGWAMCQTKWKTPLEISKYPAAFFQQSTSRCKVFDPRKFRENLAVWHLDLVGLFPSLTSWHHRVWRVHNIKSSLGWVKIPNPLHRRKMKLIPRLPQFPTSFLSCYILLRPFPFQSSISLRSVPWFFLNPWIHGFFRPAGAGPCWPCWAWRRRRPTHRWSCASTWWMPLPGAVATRKSMAPEAAKKWRTGLTFWMESMSINGL